MLRTPAAAFVSVLAFAMTFVGAGCGRTPDFEPLPPVGHGPAMDLLPVFTQTVNNDIDIVFMIDDSGSMREEQANIRRNFPAFTSVLKNLPQGLPNIHVGVVSSDLGAGKLTGVPGCALGGDMGRFQNTPRGMNGACTSVPTDSYISSIGPVHNYPGDIDDVLACVAELGTRGCGFEHQLQSVRAALDPDLMPAGNRGFLRDEAILAIVLVTDEDDCSAPPDSTLFDPNPALVSSLGVLDSFRCNEFGHLCSGKRPPTTPTTNIQDCHSAEDGRLVRIGDLVTFFKMLKANPDDVMVAAITGPPEPYSVRLATAMRTNDTPANAPEIVPSCMSANGSAAPAVRINEFVGAFGDNGTFLSICTDDFSPAMTRIGEEIARRASLECLASPVADVDPDQPGVQAHCEVYEQTAVGAGSVSTLIPSCATVGATTPCWSVQPAPKCAQSGVQMLVDRGGAAPPPGTRLNVICETCQDPTDTRCKR